MGCVDDGNLQGCLLSRMSTTKCFNIGAVDYGPSCWPTSYFEVLELLVRISCCLTMKSEWFCTAQCLMVECSVLGQSLLPPRKIMMLSCTPVVQVSSYYHDLLRISSPLNWLNDVH